MATTNYDIDREGIKAATDAEMETAINEMESGYNSIIAENNATKNSMLTDIEDVKNEQIAAANKNTELAIDTIEKQKEWAQKDYIKEQSASYADYQKQSNRYGANAEQMAGNGLTNTGYSESSQVAMYTAYQNRVAVARESYQRSCDEFAIAIANAQAQNSSVLAEIAASALEQSLQATMTFAQMNNTLLTEKVKQKQAIKDSYYQRYLSELDAIIKEKTFQETMKQNEEKLQIEKEAQEADEAYKQEQLAIERKRLQLQYNANANKHQNSGVTTSGKKATTYNTKSHIEQNKNAKETGYPTTYEGAVEFMKKNGLNDFNVMTRTEWLRRKGSYVGTGVGGVAVSANAKYEDYLASICKYAES